MTRSRGEGNFQKKILVVDLVHFDIKKSGVGFVVYPFAWPECIDELIFFVAPCGIRFPLSDRQGLPLSIILLLCATCSVGFVLAEIV